MYIQKQKQKYYTPNGWVEDCIKFMFFPEKGQDNLHILYNCINPLPLRVISNQFPPINITPKTNIEVMRIKEMITN